MGEYKLGTLIHDGCVYEIYLDHPPTVGEILRFKDDVAQLKPGMPVLFMGTGGRVVQTAARPLAGAVIEETFNGYSQRYAAETPEAALELKRANEGELPAGILVAPPMTPEQANELRVAIEKSRTGKWMVMPELEKARDSAPKLDVLDAIENPRHSAFEHGIDIPKEVTDKLESGPGGFRWKPVLSDDDGSYSDDSADPPAIVGG